ncbi:SDR family NAD(P)-dependent oxidoreductase [Thiomicrorhabdus lithotrophica]|uniref:SDR family NAD(P)-dependent oxidoreductase n=1 Tax=Thiomicrorhabdus lithotrophica TaxID=2949997 RepID=A0ABY8C7C9_9GAMM|nr:SDR family NAD(P)-dependent oxidoreductase [Thiomicrorhabdus lithotrophica]WEJ61865.1 SDR family NAD(P)-dependent oxidoreductase [Thiomicrorhabdus lithotrophica]
MTENNKTQKRIWLVGGSEGIGLALVMQLLEENYQLVVSSRNAQQSPELMTLQDENPNNLSLLDCDVTKKNSLAETSYQAWSVYDGLDIWIYNAGIYHPMKLQDWNIDAFDTMNQVNYLGAVYLMNHLLPLFTAVKTANTTNQPQWLWNISLASDFGLPYGGGYSAPKAALQNLAESLQPELSKTGIELKVVNHGFVKTRLTAKNDFEMLGLMEAEDAAQKIKQALIHNRFETRFPFNLALVLGTIKRLPKSWALAITKRMLKDG